MEIPRTYFDSPMKIAELIVAKFDELKVGQQTVQSIKLSVKYNALTESLKFTSSNPDYHVGVVTVSDYLLKVLGISVDYTAGAQSGEEDDLKLHFAHLTKPTKKCNLETLSMVYAYSDLIQYQLVGDTMAPLLGVFPIQGKAGDQIYWPFNPPYYLPCRKNYINEIEIRLCDSKGRTFDIPSGETVAFLHFRKQLFMRGI